MINRFHPQTSSMIDSIYISPVPENNLNMTWSDVNSSKLSPEQRYVSGGEGRTRTQPKTVAREPILDLVIFKRRVHSLIFHNHFNSDDLKTTVVGLKLEERELHSINWICKIKSNRS